ncbi:NUDIX hydrolase domain-like protein [Fimicolochytrium jonesii]|uniref:NUDIX hydrolase domain-like protein n=1 Tax=Fimicolochytrium jonesii TaxID=1396493 RepID=UPI0022FE06F5|nr:NUDIX hydrolase domain-like protein [Fimicolochytrium jonesii]KAI8826694.1 NUDIX hydrolase domain-like protein [Fimicolochytrium jonesii]
MASVNQQPKIIVVDGSSTTNRSDNPLYDLLKKVPFRVENAVPSKVLGAEELADKPAVVIFADLDATAVRTPTEWPDRLTEVRRALGKSVFVVLWSQLASDDVGLRIKWRRKDVNMITASVDHLRLALDKISDLKLPPSTWPPATSAQPLLGCPYCPEALPLDLLYDHVPLYHTQEPNNNDPLPCPACSYPHCRLSVHFHEDHSPSWDTRTDKISRKDRIPIYGLTVCRNPKDGRYLLIEEPGQNGWWCPGGGVDPGEDLAEGAKREVLEEAGVEVEMKGILRVEFQPAHPRGRRYPRLRVVFYAEPVPSTPEKPNLPKTLPDYESVSACYVSVEDIEKLPLRGAEPLIWGKYISDGGMIWPMEVLGRGGDAPPAGGPTPLVMSQLNP